MKIKKTHIMLTYEENGLIGQQSLSIDADFEQDKILITDSGQSWRSNGEMNQIIGMNLSLKLGLVNRVLVFLEGIRAERGTN